MMLLGLRSRWVIPFACAAPMASVIWPASSRKDGSGSPPSGIRSTSVLPGDQLHGDEVEAGIVFQGVDGDDVRVIEGGDRGRLTLEPHAALRVARELLGQHLDRDFSSEALVDRSPHHTHSALAELGGDLEVGDARADVNHGVESSSREGGPSRAAGLRPRFPSEPARGVRTARRRRPLESHDAASEARRRRGRPAHRPGRGVTPEAPDHRRDLLRRPSPELDDASVGAQRRRHDELGLSAVAAPRPPSSRSGPRPHNRSRRVRPGATRGLR